MPTGDQPTLEMVAAAAGVSRSTVSRVVNGSPKVRPEVVEAVQEAIERLAYVPNRAARSLAGRHSYAIALLVPEDTNRFFGDPYFASVVKGITARLERSDYILNLLVTSGDPNGKTRRFLAGGNVDGALVVSHHAGDLDLIGLNEILPMVFGGRPAVPGIGDTWWVDVDNVGGAEQATRRLVERGCRRVGLISGPADMRAAMDRQQGWQAVLAERGLPTDAVCHGDFTTWSGAVATRALLERHPDLDGLFVANDLMARGALAVLADRRVRVPEEVAVVGYDDGPAATASRPHLTTVSQPSTRMGTTMAEMLLGLLADQTPVERHRVLATSLVVRETA